ARSRRAGRDGNAAAPRRRAACLRFAEEPAPAARLGQRRRVSRDGPGSLSELTDQERVALLTERLGLPPGSLPPELALEALRHGSYVHERSLAPGREQLRSNERLEFLGDAVLGFAI